MKKIYFIALMATIAIACSREQGLSNEPAADIDCGLTFTVIAPGTEDQTKTTRDVYGKIFWSPSESISIFEGIGDGGGRKFTSTNTEPVRKAEFTGIISVTIGSPKALESREFWGIYPYDSENAFDGSAATMVIPHIQASAEGTFSDGQFPSIGHSKGLVMGFYNVCGGLRFKVSHEGVTSVIIRGNDEEELAGKVKVSIDEKGRPKITEVLEAMKEIVVKPLGGGSFKTGVDYFVSICPVSFKQGVTFEFHRYDGRMGTRVVDTPFSIGRSLFQYSDNPVDSGVTLVSTPETVDLGLSVKWASFNVGAASPEDYGEYFAWGETAAKDNFSWDNYKWRDGSLTKYTAGLFSESTDNKTCLDLEDDAAHVLLGDKWRMPTLTECWELLDSCTWTWTSLNGIYGSRVTSKKKGYTDKSIFLPAAGYRDGTDLSDEGESGRYWTMNVNSGVPGFPGFVNEYHFSSSGEDWWDHPRYCGFSVRPVYGDFVPVESVSFDKDVLTLSPGESVNLRAVTVPANASDRRFIIKSSNEHVAETNSNKTKYEVFAMSPGSAEISIETPDGSLTGKCIVNVASPVSEVILDKESLSLSVGDQVSLTALVKPDDAINKSVSWSSNATGVATVDNNGKVTAVAVGTATITVTTVDGGKTATCKVTVNPIAVTGVTLSKTSLTFTSLNATQKLTATVSPSNATESTVTWSSSNTSVATVSSDGTVTSKGSGTATITAAAGGKSATCSVTVNIPVTGVSLNKTSTSLLVGATETLTATVSPSTASNKNVTWSSNATGVATVDNNGKVTAVSVGTATITVTTVDGGKTATCKVTVNPIAVTGVTLSKTSLTFTSLNATQKLTATVSPSNATENTVSWSSSNTSVATVSSDGTVTSKGSGTATITASAGGKSATCSVTVNIPVTGVSLNKTATSLLVGASETLTATVSPSTASNKNVTWSSNATGVATVDNNGKVTAVSVGTATITVSTVDGGKTATCKVTVNPIAVTGVSLDKTTLTFTSLNATQKLKATVTPGNATYQTVTWSSSDTSVATVASDGTVTSKGSGTATITATAGGKSDTCSVTVNIPVTGVSLNKSTTSLLVGDSETLTATVAPSTATNQNVTWSSNATGVATVDNNGKVTAVSVGTATITVTTVDGGKTATCKVTVNPIAVTGVSLDKTTLTFTSLNATQKLKATVTPGNATYQTVTWSSSDTSVATVGTDGTVTSKGSGTATITATAGGKSATCAVTVTIPVSGGNEDVIDNPNPVF